MQQLPIQQTPNQAFSALLDGNQWDFTLKTVQEATAVSLTLNGNNVVNNLIAAAGALLIPAQYEEQGGGNFFFITQQFQLPYYTMFTQSQFLIYTTSAELSALRTPFPSRIIPINFNPIAALPLRFAPQGYVEA